ncbi:hypothetical protein [Methylophilus medardicus]|uniref:Uncharacterized protein n=1 Tax=Methylophilus medardicus TaxID=2588534 RepID=A0A5B8CU15_9PROT|nr:hypothetical protein [Methylophilus medardicus]QDC44818.1 hypothetical protein FIU01_09995 [Methylophilus medardicus]QDC49825.1 hypothetical protein FIU00_09995 [Methylophilus medardicus]QDC53530.1 hypothetical protein FIT99_09995 [Methylophilus medardicus]
MPENDLSTIDFKSINKRANAFAKQAVIDMNLPEEIELPKTINTLGFKLNKIYQRHYENVREDLSSKKLSRVVASALQAYWESCHDAAETLRLQFEALGYNQLTEFQQKISTATGYANYEGWAYSFYSGAFSKGKSNSKKDDLIVIALYWLAEADKLNDPREKFDHIVEALEAIQLSNGSYMWDEGFKCKSEDISREKSFAAKKAHRENYQLKSEAKNYWLLNIDPKLSNDAAAGKLQAIIPLTFRTLSSYVSEFKKEIQSASKM